jgi:hypothetical protein
MLAKKTSKNQVTLPKAAVEQFPGIDYFEVTVEKEQIRLTPVKVATAVSSLKKIRKKIAELGLTEKDVKDAVQWARKRM